VGDTQSTPFTALQSVLITPFSVASASDQVLPAWNTGVNTLGRVTPVRITWIADADCYFHFESLSSTGVNASATNSILLPAGQMFEFIHVPKVDDRVKVIRRTVDGNLYRWQSGQ
jgi:hypothetical protein